MIKTKLTERKKKSILIGGLLAVVVLMGIAYAAFASNLTITGAGSVSSNWCIGFDSTRTSDYQATAGISGGTVPTGSMSFSGDSCAGNYKTTASLNASFKQPGDKVEYTLTIGNKGTLPAAIESINVDNQSVTSDTTITKGNVKFIIEMPASTSLAVNATTTMKVTAMFQNDTDVSGSSNEQQTISVSINAVQDDGNGGFTPTPVVPTSQTVYAWNTSPITIGTSTINDLVSIKTAQPYYTSAVDVMSASNYTFFYKYIVENGTLSEEYLCQTFGISGFDPVCLKMSLDGSSYGDDTTGNKGILKTLEGNQAFINSGGFCSFSNDSASCSNDYYTIFAGSGGNVKASILDEDRYDVAYCMLNTCNG